MWTGTAVWIFISSINSGATSFGGIWGAASLKTSPRRRGVLSGAQGRFSGLAFPVPQRAKHFISEPGRRKIQRRFEGDGPGTSRLERGRHLLRFESGWLSRSVRAQHVGQRQILRK